MFRRVLVACATVGVTHNIMPSSGQRKKQSYCGGVPKPKDPEVHKLFNDPIHGSMEFHPALVAIIDTPEFQRLRDIKQLGAVYYVYPGASHNRYEHSLGVCHIAGQLMEHLKKKQPTSTNSIELEDVLMVQIAGLCHDLGHGPFSHTFDQKFMPAATGKHFEHEELSLAMFDHMLENNRGVKKMLLHYGIDDERIKIIRDMIHKKDDKTDGQKGDKKDDRQADGPNPWPPEKNFMFEPHDIRIIACMCAYVPNDYHQIVANKRNGVDVDKWDYFKRDMYHLGMQAPFDHERMIKFYRITKDADDGGKTTLCARDKEAMSVYEIFTTRQTIHRRACQHRAVMAVEAMLVNGLIAADEYIKLKGKGGKTLTMSQCADENDPVAFTKLTDSVFYQILASDDPNLASAKAWFKAVQDRKMYRLVAETGPMTDPKFLKLEYEEINKQIHRELIKIIEKDNPQVLCSLKEIEPFKHAKCPEYKFIVQHVRLDFGKKDDNPVDNFKFYRKLMETGEQNEGDEAIVIKASQISTFLPQNKREEIIVRILLRPTDNKEEDEKCFEALTSAYKKWFEKTFPEFQPMICRWTFSRYD